MITHLDCNQDEYLATFTSACGSTLLQHLLCQDLIKGKNLFSLSLFLIQINLLVTVLS